MLAKEDELVKVKERQLQAEEQLKEFELKQQQVGVYITLQETQSMVSLILVFFSLFATAGGINS